MALQRSDPPWIGEYLMPVSAATLLGLRYFTSSSSTLVLRPHAMVPLKVQLASSRGAAESGTRRAGGGGHARPS
jgi:hypothetical protein